MMQRMKRWAVMCVLGSGLLGGCGDEDPPKAPLPDAGIPDAGPRVDGGTQENDGGTQENDGGTQENDGGTQENDGGTQENDGGTQGDGGALEEPLPCERTQGVCAGARRAMVDGAYEPVCTARSYGVNYEAVESRCDGLDNDCDGVTDPPSWSQVAPLRQPLHAGRIGSLRVADGVLAVAFDTQAAARIIRMDTALSPLGITEVPVEVQDASIALDSVSSRLLRTSRGPALYYSSAGYAGDHTRGHLLLLDEQGRPVAREGEPAEGMLLFDQAVGDRATMAAVSADGTRVLATWRDVASIWEGGRVVSGTITDLDGQVLAAPRVLMQALDNGTILSTQTVMGLRDGGFLVLVLERVDSAQQGVLRLQRFDEDLKPVGEMRNFPADAYPEAKLVELGADAGGPLESPVMVLRSQQGGTQAIKVLGNLFGEVTTQTLAVTTPGKVPWFGVATTARRLQLAWLAVSTDPQVSDPLFRWRGRFWGLGHGGSPMDWTPGPALLPLHRYSQWVRLEELPENWMGALVMTSTQSPETHTLQAVRYCAP